jgi:uncharacterized protein
MYAATQEERTMAMLCHIGGVIGMFMAPVNIIVPVVIWLLKKDQSAFVSEHGKEAINFQINLSVWALVLGIVMVVLMIVLIGFLLIPVLIALGIAGLILGIIAGIKAYEGNYYRYPFIFRLIK